MKFLFVRSVFNLWFGFMKLDICLLVCFIVVFFVLMMWYSFNVCGFLNFFVKFIIVLFINGDCIMILLNVCGYISVVIKEIVLLRELLIKIWFFFIWYVG